MNLLFSFFGRTGRGGFWLGVLAGIVISLVVMGIAALLVPWSEIIVKSPDGKPLTGADGQPMIDFANAKMVPAYIVYGVGSLLSLWIGLAVYVKRCHDRGKSGWWLLLMLIPFVGIIWWLVDLGILEGQQGANKYGPDPRAV
jgi:uncharacterized membrane protein YhaH (DUF805 family)